MFEEEMDEDGMTKKERELEILLRKIDDNRYQALVVVLGARGKNCVKEMSDYIMKKKPKTIYELVKKFIQSEIVD